MNKSKTEATDPKIEPGESSLARMVGVLRAENKALREQVLSHNRTIAALVMQAGGDVRVDELTLALMPLNAEILIWSEPMERKTIVQIRTPKHPNDPDQRPGTPKL